MYTTRRILKGGRLLLHQKMVRSVNVVIFWQNTSSDIFTL